MVLKQVNKMNRWTIFH